MRLLVPILLALHLVGGHGHARVVPAGERPGAGDSIPPEEVADRADILLDRLEAARPDAAAEAPIRQIEQGLAALGPRLDGLLERATAARAEAAPIAALDDLRRELDDASTPLRRWRDALAAEARRVASILGELAEARRRWSETRDRPETAAAGDPVTRRVESSLQAIDQATATLGAWRARVLALGDRLADRAITVDAALEKLREAAHTEESHLFVPDRAPLWQRGFGSELLGELPRVPEELLAYNKATREYLARDARPFVVQAVMVALLMLALRRFATAAGKRLADAREPSRAARLLERPYAIALLLGLLVSPALHPLAPQRLIQLLGMLALFPAARILLHATDGASLTAFGSAFVLLLLDRVALALTPLPALARGAFLLSLAIALGLTLRFARRVRRSGDAPWLVRAALVATTGLALALFLEIAGWTELASLVGRSILSSAITGLYVYTAVIAVQALVAYALVSPTLRRSHVVGRNETLLRERLERGLAWLGAGLWLYLVLTALGLRSAGADALRALAQTGISIGALSLSIGGVVGFVLTLVAAFLLARIVTGVLEEDVYPRTSLPRGIPYALSTLVRYGVYSLGFLLALAASGVQLSQLAILLGGLGVGVGLGLQDLVKNFAAGLTLLFERRVHVGDAVEISNQGIFGRVLAIGTRASVIRNWNGSEVVVPNADLVSGAVTNWTLSDRLHRIEVPVGVAYGTDPARVVALLLDVARANDRLLESPAPQALFKGFGESSLDFVLRAWTDQEYEGTLGQTSEVALAVHRTLSEAGITIPFPQRDLHLASVSPAARAALFDAVPGRREPSRA